MYNHNHDPKDDARRQSNYREKWVNQIRVEILPEKLGVTIEMAAAIQKCCKSGDFFMLSNEKECISFDPKSLTSRDSNATFIKYDNALDFINGVKLSLMACNKLFIPPTKLQREAKKRRLCP